MVFHSYKTYHGWHVIKILTLKVTGELDGKAKLTR